MLSDKMCQAMNDQINEEMFSSYLYLSMSAFFEEQGLEGMASWMKVQAQEEMIHAMKFFDQIAERDGRVVLEAIAKPDAEWESPLAAFEAAYKHEQHITGRIDTLVSVAEEEKDRASMVFLQWFVSEQVEEEATAKGIVDKLKMFGDAKHAIYMLDRELAQRTFAASADEDEE